MTRFAFGERQLRLFQDTENAQRILEYCTKGSGLPFWVESVHDCDCILEFFRNANKVDVLLLHACLHVLPVLRQIIDVMACCMCRFGNVHVEDIAPAINSQLANLTNIERMVICAKLFEACMDFGNVQGHQVDRQTNKLLSLCINALLHKHPESNDEEYRFAVDCFTRGASKLLYSIMDTHDHPILEGVVDQLKAFVPLLLTFPEANIQRRILRMFASLVPSARQKLKRSRLSRAVRDCSLMRIVGATRKSTGTVGGSGRVSMSLMLIRRCDLRV